MVDVDALLEQELDNVSRTGLDGVENGSLAVAVSKIDLGGVGMEGWVSRK